MAISENALLVIFDETTQKLIMYRPTDEALCSLKTVLHTEYSLRDLRNANFSEASRILGEGILISLAGTRDAIADE